MTRVPLGSVATIDSGAGFPVHHQGRTGGEFPFIKVSDMNLPGNERRIESWNNTVSEDVRRELRAKAFPAGSLVFPKIGAAIGTNKKRQLTRPTCVDNNVMAVVPNASRLDSDYLYFAFLAKDLSDFASASNPPSIRKSDVEGWDIPVPSMSAQRRIVDQLSRAEGIVRLRRQAQQKAAALIPAIFVDMFGDPATNSKGLDVVTLGDVLASADYGSSAKAGDEEIGLPMIRMGNVDYSGNVDLAALKYVDLPPAEVARFGLKDGDILFNRTNSKELVGKTGLWIGDREAILASYFIRLRVDERLARPFFVWAFMNTPHMKRVLFETARGAIGQANINSRELRAFRIPLPALDVQVRFEARCRDVLALRVQQDQATAKAEAAFQAILARAFSATGQAAVGRAQEEASA